MELDLGRQARQFNKSIEGIINSVLRRDLMLYIQPKDVTDYRHSRKFREIGVTRRIDDLVISSYTNKVSGIGMGNVVLYHKFLGKDNLAKSLGVDSPNRLWICLYTDEQTFPQITDLLSKELQSPAERDRMLSVELLCGTDFMFDSSGRFGRLVSIPHWIEDTPPALDETESYKVVRVDMNPGVFDIVGVILDELKGKV